jgi:1-aminocyclopropane-1-carboxylate deaminase
MKELRPGHAGPSNMPLARFAHLFGEIHPSPVQPLKISSIQDKNYKLFLKRDDLLHSVISGNKWRKLKHLLLSIESQGYHKISAMGGPYSNLLHSLAYLGRRLNWSVELVVRGYAEQPLTPMLKDALRWGATIRYVDRVTFRQLRERAPDLPDDVFWFAEGGYHPLALKGTAESLMELTDQYDAIITATATGTCLAGLALGAWQRGFRARIIGISVLNNAAQVTADIERLLPDNVPRPEVISGYEFGGYAKTSPQLLVFMAEFEANQQVPLEPTYSGKSFYGTFDLIKRGYFKENSRILLIHCGGLQARRNSSIYP